jgi:adenylate kinase
LKNRIVLLGPPASGKGTQASLLGAAFGIPYTSTGAMLRKERAEGTAIGVEAESFTSRGLLFPDELALRVVTRWLENRTRFLLDGFPRTAGQARSFDGLLAGRNLPLDIVYFLELSDDEIRSRMLGRLTCTNCGAVFNEGFHRIDLTTPCPQCAGPLARRADDTEAALACRLAQYREETLPVADHYRRVGILKAIDVTPGRDEVFKTLYDDMKEAA